MTAGPVPALLALAPAPGRRRAQRGRCSARAEAGARRLFLFLLRRVTPFFPVLGEPEEALVKELLNWTHVRLQAQIPAGPFPAAAGESRRQVSVGPSSQKLLSREGPDGAGRA